MYQGEVWPNQYAVNIGLLAHHECPPTEVYGCAQNVVYANGGI